MSKGTDVYYNGVTLTNCLTKRFSQEAVYDDTGTDLIYHRYRVRVAGFVHHHYLDSTYDQNRATVDFDPKTGSLLVNDHKQIRTLLMEPRGVFNMTLDGQSLLYATFIPGQAADSDVNSGPHPQMCEITHIAGANGLRVEFEIEICKVDCLYNTNTLGVTSNRWSFEEQIDEDFYRTRTIRGKLRVAHVNLSPQAYRFWVVPGLQPGFSRKVIDVITSPDGLTMDYIVVDREQWAAPPFPAVKWHGTHTASTDNGARTWNEVHVVLEGARDTDKLKLIDLAVFIGLQKVEATGMVQKDFHLEHAAIVDHMHANMVEFRMQCSRPTKFAKNGMPVATIGKFIVYPGYDRDQFPIPKLYGADTPTNMLVCYLQSPCNNAHLINHAVVQADSQGLYGNAGGDSAVRTSQGYIINDNEIDANISDEHKRASYTYYEMESEYDINDNNVQLPLARAPAGGTDPSCVIAPLCEPTCKRVVKVRAQRIGDWPLIPSPTSYADANGIMQTRQRFKLNAEAPELTADGKTRKFTISAVIHYALERVPGATELFQSGSLPWDNFNLSMNSVPPEAFGTGLA